MSITSAEFLRPLSGRSSRIDDVLTADTKPSLMATLGAISSRPSTCHAGPSVPEGTGSSTVRRRLYAHRSAASLEGFLKPPVPDLPPGLDLAPAKCEPDRRPASSGGETRTRPSGISGRSWHLPAKAGGDAGPSQFSGLFGSGGGVIQMEFATPGPVARKGSKRGPLASLPPKPPLARAASHSASIVAPSDESRPGTSASRPQSVSAFALPSLERPPSRNSSKLVVESASTVLRKPSRQADPAPADI